MEDLKGAKIILTKIIPRTFKRKVKPRRITRRLKKEYKMVEKFLKECL